MPTHESPPRGLLVRLLRGLLAHVLGYVGTTWRVFVVGSHFGWLMMALISLTEGGTPHEATKLFGKWLIQGQASLGGVDERGHGGIPELMTVWGKLSLVIYAEERARELTKRACDMNDGMACMRQASAVESAAQGREDMRQAEALYRRACELGNADGCAGVAYLSDHVHNGPPKDPAVVAEFFERACRLGKTDVRGKRSH